MRMQAYIIQKLTIKPSGIHFHATFSHAIIFALTSLLSVGYATSSGPSSQPVLTEKTKNYIKLLSNSQQKIPSWLVAELLPFSDQLRQFASSQPAGTPVRLNELLANCDRYKSKLVVIEGRYIQAVEVGKELQLLPPDRGWSVILLDLDYLQPIQLFTSQDPSVFKKNSAIEALGVFLTNRIDQPKGAFSSKSITIPVLVGTLMAPGPEKSFTKTARSTTTSIIILVGIAILVAIFIKIKISLSKSSRPGKISQLISDRGRMDGKGTT